MIMFRWLRAALMRGKPEWESFRLTISANVVQRVSASLPVFEISRTEVTAIVAQPDGLLLKTGDRHRALLVPQQLIDFSDARERLSTWRDFEAPKQAWNGLLGFAWAGLLLGSLLATLLLTDLRWALLAGAVLLAVASLIIWQVRKVQGLSNVHKGSLIRVLRPLMFAPLLRIVLYVFHSAPWLR
jgi:hypothetical protein